MSEGVIYYGIQRITSITFRAMSAGKEQTISQAKLNNDYIGRNNHLNAFYHEGGQTATENTGARTLMRRIGSTNYRIAIHFSETSRETMDEKIIRLVKNESALGKAAGE